MLARVQLPCGDPGEVDAQASDGDVDLAENVADLDVDPEFFSAFAYESGLRRLLRLDLAAGKLPLARVARRAASLRREQAPGGVTNRRADDQSTGIRGSCHPESMPSPPALTPDQVAAELATLPGWSGDTTAIKRTIECSSFPAAIAVVDVVATAAEAANHHPDIDVRWRTLHFTLSTHDAGGVTGLDIALAREIDAAAASG